MREIKSSFFIVFFTFLALLIYTKVFGPIPFSVNSVTITKNDLFTVTGTGEVTAVPNTADVTLGVTKTAPLATDAQAQINTIIQKITKDLLNKGVTKNNIVTSNYSIDPNIDYTQANPTPDGYTATATIDVTISPVTLANSAIDIATTDGATDIDGVSFIVDDKTRQKDEDQARIAAINNAKDKAQTIANTSGLRLLKIINVTEDQNTPILQPLPLEMNAVAGLPQRAQPPTQLNPGENTITVNVTISYQTE